MVTVKVVMGAGKDQFTIKKTNSLPNYIERYELVETLLEVIDAINVAYGSPHQKEHSDLRKLLKEKLK